MELVVYCPPQKHIKSAKKYRPPVFHEVDKPTKRQPYVEPFGAFQIFYYTDYGILHILFI